MSDLNVFDFLSGDEQSSDKEYLSWNKKTFLNYLKKCDEYYYNEGSDPLISDSLYDEMRTFAEKKWPTESYFKNVGSKTKMKGFKVKHPVILGSLKKTKSNPEDADYIGNWLSKYNNNDEFIITPKLDGISIYAEFDSEIKHAATRGDAYEGTSITKKAQVFSPKLSIPCEVHLRGETILPGNIYEEIGYSNRRNGASGIIGSDDGKNCEHLVSIFYELIWCSEFNVDTKTEEERLEFISRILPKENCVPWFKFKKKDISVELLKQKLIDIKDQYKDICDIDGLVITKNNSIRENVKHPDHKIAFKVNSEKATAIVDFINWETSRTGRIVPVVNFKEAVDLCGAKIIRATGYNAKFIVDNKISTGSIIEVERSGDVIPRIIKVIG